MSQPGKSAAARTRHCPPVRRAALAALSAVVLTATAAPAWEAHRAVDGQYLRWAGPGAVVRVRLISPPAALHLRGAEGLRSAVVAAASAWQAVSSAHVPVRWGGTATHGFGSGGLPGGFLPLAAFLARRRRRAALVRAVRSLRRAPGVRSGLALALVLGSFPAHASKRSVNSGGLCVFWATRGHSFLIDGRGTPDVVGTAAFTAVRKSFAAWAGVPGSDLSFPDQGLSLDPKNRKIGFFPGQFNVNLVLWRTANCASAVPPGDACLQEGGCGNKYDCWDHGDAVIATTTTTSNRYTGQISDTDIELNDAPGSDGSTKFVFTANDGPPCSDPNQTGCVRTDIENTITHEAGHSLGLDHTTVPDATMFATAPEGEISKRTLHDDDIQAIQGIYPAGKPTVTCISDPITLTQTGSANSAGCSTASSVGALPLLALLSLLRRRKR